MASVDYRLFLDDESIASQSGLTRVWHQPGKYDGSPVLKSDKPWEGRHCYLYGTVLHVGGKWQMWYQTFDPAIPGRAKTTVCYAESPDGLEWTKPVLGGVEFSGSRANNIVIERYGEQGGSLYSPSVSLDPTDSQYPYKMFWHDSSNEIEGDYVKLGVSAARSADGIHWTYFENNPLRLKSSDVLAVIYDPNISKYVAYVKMGYGDKKARARSESADTMVWTKPEYILYPDKTDPGDVGFYWSTHQPYADMYVGLLGVLHKNQGMITTELVFSRDGINWQRTPDRSVFLPLGKTGEFDASMITCASPPFVEDGSRLRLYYGGFSHPRGSLETPVVTEKVRASIGLAFLRKDGFASLRAEGEGNLVTKPFTAASSDLLINADATGGEIRAELLDEQGHPIPGFTLADCRPITTDSVRHAVTWTSSKFSSLKGRTISVRIVMKNTDLYSIRP